MRNNFLNRGDTHSLTPHTAGPWTEVIRSSKDGDYSPQAGTNGARSCALTSYTDTTELQPPCVSAAQGGDLKNKGVLKLYILPLTATKQRPTSISTRKKMDF